MTGAIAIHGHDIIDLVSEYPGGIRLSQLMEVVDQRFGKSVSFHTCSAMSMELDGLLRFLEARDKVRTTSGVVYPVVSSIEAAIPKPLMKAKTAPRLLNY